MAEVMAEAMGLTLDEIREKTNRHAIVHPRYVILALLYENTRLVQLDIIKLTGLRGRASVSVATRMIREQPETFGPLVEKAKIAIQDY